MATISGKRFQITDGASTPTNLFPYTVTEAVYGLSTVIENAKTAVTSVLSAVTLNGVSKAGTTASFYAPTTAGTAGQILISLGSGAPAWTSVARGNSNTPIYINSSGVLTEGVACLPLTGGTITSSARNTITLNSTHSSGSNYIPFQINGTTKVYLGYDASGGAFLQNYAASPYPYINIPNSATTLYWNNTNPFYHSGNSNKSDVAWACSSLAAAVGVIDANRNPNTGALYDSAKMGFELETYSTYVSLKAYKTDGTSLGTLLNLANTGNVGIGTTSPTYKLDVNGTVGVSEHIYMANNKYLYRYDSSGTARSILDYDSSNGAMLFCWGNATGGYSTSICGNTISLRYGTSHTVGMTMDASGNVGIGTTSPGYKLDVNGTIRTVRLNFNSSNSFIGAGIQATTSLSADDIVIHANNGSSYTQFRVYCSLMDVRSTIQTTGDQVVSSDATLKTNLTPVTYSVADIAKARAVEFDWKDGRGHSMGSIAQDWLGIAPALVHGEEGNMSLAYGQLALVNTIIEARAIESLQVHESEQDKEIRELRERIARLEMENERLRMN